MATPPTESGNHPLIVLDEFPFLAKASPELPSLLQRSLGPQPSNLRSFVRLLLCGSALSFMNNLLSGSAPLRGRASLELLIPPFDYRLAAAFWKLNDPRLALLVNSVVGGTPAYARQFTLGDTPKNRGDFGAWVQRNVLNPSRPLFREARFLLSEEPELRNAAIYQGILSAIAQGNHTRGGIANYLLRKSTDLGHALNVLEDTGLVGHEIDAFHSKRSTYRICEPILTFYHALMRPEWSELERPGRAGMVWNRNQSTFLSQVIGPHFEEICRSWTRWYADQETLDGQSNAILSGSVPDPAARMTHQLDIVAFGQQAGAQRRLLAIGEAKWNQRIDLSHLRRLEHIRELLQRRSDLNPGSPRLLFFSGAGFSQELQKQAANSPEIQLIDLERLYYGS